MKVSKPKFMGLILALIVTLVNIQAATFILLACIYIMGIGFEVED